MNKKNFNLTVLGLSVLVLFGASVAVQAAENPFTLAENYEIEVLALAPPSAVPENNANPVNVDDGNSLPQNE